MVIGEESAVAFEEAEQPGHQLEVGGHVGIVSVELEMAELQVDDVLDVAASGVEFAIDFRRFGGFGGERVGPPSRRCGNARRRDEEEAHGKRKHGTKERARQRGPEHKLQTRRAPMSQRHTDSSCDVWA